MDYDLKLISQVKRHPVLYDFKNADFTNKEFKNELWRMIAYNMKRSREQDAVKAVRMRWKSLRDSYVKEKKRRAAMNEANNVKPKKDWRYSKPMEFLSPFITLNGSKSSLSVKNEEKKSECEDPVMENEDSYILAPEDPSEAFEEGFREHFLGEWLNYFSPDLRLLASSHAPQGNQNDIDSFFRGLADTVKKLNPINQVRIQRDIVNMVLDVKLQEIQGNKN